MPEGSLARRRLQERIDANLQRQKEIELERFARQENLARLEQQAAEDKERQTAQALASHLALLSYTISGPAQIFAQAGGDALGDGGRGGGGVGDNGQELIDLIQSVIEPRFWDVNGGPGTIFYYAPLHALVVRATSQVHEKIGGALGAVRAAGR